MLTSEMNYLDIGRRRESNRLNDVSIEKKQINDLFYNNDVINIPGSQSYKINCNLKKTNKT